MIFAQRVETIDKYDVVIVPALYCADEKITDTLKAYVEKGGVLLSGFKSFVADRNVKVSHDVLPSGMTEVFGVNYNQSTRPEDVTVNGVPAQFFMELLNVTTAESIYNYEHYVWDKYCAFAKNNYKSGKAFYVGYVPEDNQLKEILSLVLKEANVEMKEENFPVIVKEGYVENEKITFVMNFSKDENTYILKENAKDIINNREYKKGEEIVFSPWGFFVYTS